MNLLNQFFIKIEKEINDIDGTSKQFVNILLKCKKNNIEVEYILNQFFNFVLNTDSILFKDNINLIIENIINFKIDNNEKYYIIFICNSIFNLLTTIEIVEDNIDSEYDNAIYKNFQKEISNFKTKIEKTEKDIDKQEEKINNLLPQSIASIGVFVAVIVVMFGGFNLISAFQNLGNQPTLRILLAVIFTGQIIFNVLFLLMFLLARLAGKPIHTACIDFVPQNNSSDEKYNQHQFRHCLFCNKSGSKEIPGMEKCSQLKRGFCKYPYVYVTNAFFVLLEIILGVTYFTIILFKNNLITHHLLFIISISAITLIIISVLTYLIYGWSKSKFKDGKEKKAVKKILIQSSIMIVILLMVLLLSLNYNIINI